MHATWPAERPIWPWLLAILLMSASGYGLARWRRQPPPAGLVLSAPTLKSPTISDGQVLLASSAPAPVCRPRSKFSSKLLVMDTCKEYDEIEIQGPFTCRTEGDRIICTRRAPSQPAHRHSQ